MELPWSCHAVPCRCLCMFDVFFTRWASRHQHDGHGGGMPVMVVDVYVCGLFTNSRHNASLGSTGTWPRVSWPSEASVPRVSWASRHLHVQGRLALALLAPIPCCPCPRPSDPAAAEGATAAPRLPPAAQEASDPAAAEECRASRQRQTLPPAPRLPPAAQEASDPAAAEECGASRLRRRRPRQPPARRLPWGRRGGAAQEASDPAAAEACRASRQRQTLPPRAWRRQRRRLPPDRQRLPLQGLGS